MEGTSGLVSFVTWIKVLLLLHTSWPSTECYYELSAYGHDVCSSGTRLNSTVDLVCRVQGQRESRNCLVTDIKWFRTSGVNTYEITTSSKYGVWESVKGWGVDGQERVALLRVRGFELGDIARYSCHMTCDYGSGLKRILQLHADVCLEEDDLKGLQCPVLVEQNSCSYSFQNGRCENQCDVREHLYDGFDCALEVPDCPHNDDCVKRYADGVCNEQCNIPECQWDGGDCVNTALDLANDHILVKVERPLAKSEEPHQPSHRNLKYRALSRSFSRISRSLLRIVPEPREDSYFAMKHRPYSDSYSHSVSQQHYLLDLTKAYDNIVLKLDNTNCEKRCLRHVHYVAQFLQLSDIRDSSGTNIHAITVLREKPNMCRSSNTSLLHLEITDTAFSYDLLNTGTEGSPEEEDEPPDWDFNMWIIGLCVIGTLIILGLLVAIFGVIICIRSEQHHSRVDKNWIHSPFHKDLNRAVEV